jgi:transmembrane sensor
MSAADEGDKPGNSVAMSIESCAAYWVADRRNSEDWTPERQAELDAWLAQSAAHHIAYLRIEGAWSRTDRLAALRRPMLESTEVAGPRRAFWIRIVAVFALIAVTGVFAGDYFFRPQMKLIETPIGGQERLTLADGSQIELNTDTAIRVGMNDRARIVELIRGEAYFQIRHDTARPFVVSVSGNRIVDLGTKFLVRIASQSLQIALIEGRARLESASNQGPQHGLILTPGDLAVASSGTTRITRKSEREISESLAWQRGSIVFDKARLADAVAEFNRYGGPQLDLVGSDIEKLTVSGTFPTTGAEDFAGVAREIFGLRVEHQDGKIILSR